MNTSIATIQMLRLHELIKLIVLSEVEEWIRNKMSSRNRAASVS